VGRLIVIQFITLDGVVEDPDGTEGTPWGGWAMRHGREAVAGDKFRLGPLLGTATLLFGRRTWQHFSTLWPPRTDDFSRAMNAASKAVIATRPLDVSAWSNSRLIERPLEDWTRQELAGTDVVLIGSTSVVTRLAAADLIDEYRLRIFPTAAGAGSRLFADPARLDLISSDRMGPTVLAILSTRGA
jgi:dihydrofolate reductase